MGRSLEPVLHRALAAPSRDVNHRPLPVVCIATEQNPHIHSQALKVPGVSSRFISWFGCPMALAVGDANPGLNSSSPPLKRRATHGGKTRGFKVDCTPMAHRVLSSGTLHKQGKRGGTATR